MLVVFAALITFYQNWEKFYDHLIIILSHSEEIIWISDNFCPFNNVYE